MLVSTKEGFPCRLITYAYVYLHYVQFRVPNISRTYGDWESGNVLYISKFVAEMHHPNTVLILQSERTRSYAGAL